MLRPNLFQYATSELSQDAFICWMLDWLNYPSASMNSVSKSFVEEVLGVEPKWEDVSRIFVHQQFSKIDVLAVFEFQSEDPIVVAIEDKIDASASNPFDLYIREVREHGSRLAIPEGLPKGRFHAVIFKTGYDFALVAPAGWTLSTFRQLSKWMENIKGQPVHPILEDWFAAQQVKLNRLADLESRVRGALQHACPTDNTRYDSEWSNQDFQFEFMLQLFRIGRKEFTVSDESQAQPQYRFRAAYAPDLEQWLSRGTSAGRQWVQLWFDPLHLFFYRFDWLRGFWGLSLRTYKHDRSDVESDRIRRGVEWFRSSLSRLGIQTVQCQTREGAIETSRLLIDPCQVQNLGKMADVHQDFVAWLRAAPGAMGARPETGS